MLSRSSLVSVAIQTKRDVKALAQALPAPEIFAPITTSEIGWRTLPRPIGDLIAAVKNVHELRAAMQRRIAGVLANDLTFQIPEEDARADKARELVQEQIFNIPNLNRYLTFLLLGKAYGLGAVELIWERAGAGWRLSGMDEFDIRYLGLNRDRQLLLRDFASDLPEEFWNAGGTIIDPYKIAFLSTSSKRLRGESYVENAYVAARSLFLVQKFWLMTCERFGAPTIIGKRTGSAIGAGFEGTQAGEDQVWKVLNSLRSMATAEIPEGVEIDLLESDLRGVSSGLFQQLADFLEGAIRKLILGADLTMDAGERGARALGEVQERGENDILREDARDLEECLQNQVVNRILTLNGYEPDIVQTNIEIRESIDQMQRAQFVEIVQNLGLTLSNNWARDFLGGIPEPESDEDSLMKPAAPNPFDIPAAGLGLGDKGLETLGLAAGKAAGEAFFQLALFGENGKHGGG